MQKNAYNAYTWWAVSFFFAARSLSLPIFVLVTEPWSKACCTALSINVDHNQARNYFILRFVLEHVEGLLLCQPTPSFIKCICGRTESVAEQIRTETTEIQSDSIILTQVPLNRACHSRKGSGVMDHLNSDWLPLSVPLICVSHRACTIYNRRLERAHLTGMLPSILTSVMMAVPLMPPHVKLFDVKKVYYTSGYGTTVFIFCWYSIQRIIYSYLISQFFRNVTKGLILVESRQSTKLSAYFTSELLPQKHVS